MATGEDQMVAGFGQGFCDGLTDAAGGTGGEAPVTRANGAFFIVFM